MYSQENNRLVNKLWITSSLEYRVEDKYMRLWISLIMAGVTAAFALGGFLKIVELITDEKVYTLLLNVDYFPVIQDWQMGEGTEFSLHIFVSIVLVIGLYWVSKQLRLYWKIYPYIIVNIILGGLLYLTTAFSERTPYILDVTAFIYWEVGHLIYGAIVGCFILFIKTKKV